MKSSPRHIIALDSLRGLAALTVVFHHNLLAMPVAASAAIRSYLATSPFSVVVEGRPAVLLFFMLSGFVLTLSMAGPALPVTPATYPRYVVKRLCRIYIPFAILGILFAALLYLALSPLPPMPDMGGWFHASWTTLTPATYLGHLLMLGREQDGTLNNVVWSLWYELRISLIFPFLLLAMRRLHLLASLAAMVLLTLAADYLLADSGLPSFYYDGHTILQSFGITLHFIPFFMAGILLALHHQAIGAWFKRRNRWEVGFLWLITLLNLSQISDSRLAPAIALLLALSLHTPSVNGFLSLRPLQWLGRVSYSLYLVHLPVILAGYYLLYGLVPLPLLVALTFPVSFLLAHLGHSLIERPAIALGKTTFRKQA